MQKRATTRISASSYLNAAPLNYLLHYGEVPDWLEVRFEGPAAGAEALRNGRADLCILPAVEFQRIPGLVVLPGMAIASPGRVRSVVVLSRRPFEELRHIGVTAKSRASVALLQVISSEFLGHRLELTPFDSYPEAMDRFDGALLIGDEALTTPAGALRVTDLAELWRRHTGLPFVFAIWAARRESCSQRLVDFLHRSKRAGLTGLPRIAADFSSRLGMTPAAVEDYLSGNISYELGPAELESLDLYFCLCHRHGLTGRPRPLEFGNVDVHPG